MSSAAHRNPMPPGFWRMGSTGALPLGTAVTARTSPGTAATSATITDQGAGSDRASGARGAPPAPGCLRKAIFPPSPDHKGITCDVDADEPDRPSESQGSELPNTRSS